MSLGSFCGAAAQSNRYIEMDLGMNAAPPPPTSWTNAFGRGEDIRYTVTTDDNGFWGLGVSLKYLF